MKPLLLLCLSLPPPYSGEETLGVTLKYALDELQPADYRIEYFDVSNKHTNQTRGRFNFRNIYVTVHTTFLFCRVLFQKQPAVVYIPLAQNFFGFLKYSTFIQIASLFHCKIISCLGGGNFDFFFKSSSLWMRMWIKNSLGKIDRMIVQGETLKQQFQGLYPTKKMRVASLGIIPDADLTNNDRVLSKFGGRLNILYVGCLSRAKGTIDLLNAFLEIRKTFDFIHLHLAGEILKKEKNIMQWGGGEEDYSIILDILKSVDCHSSIIFHGVVTGPAKTALYKTADIFVMPSYSESFPFVLLEAAAAGLALLSTPVGAIREVYCEGDNILFFSPGDVKTLTEKLTTLICDTGLRNKMREKNRDLILANYTHLSFGKRMDILFREVMK